MSSEPGVVVARLRGGGPLAFLDGASDDDGLGRWSHVAVDPVTAVVAWGRRVVVVRADRLERLEADPLTVLEREVERLPRSEAGDPRPVKAGAIGFVGYEIGRTIERLPAPKDDHSKLPDLVFFLFPDIAGYDARSGRWHGGSDRVRAAIVGEGEDSDSCPAAAVAVTPDLAVADYLEKVVRIREHIFAGDVYQVNLSQRFRAHSREDPYALYRRMRRRRPAPLGAFLEYGKRAILSNSPELFLHREGEYIETRPIKGTRPRSDDPVTDEILARELETSPKEQAELTMIVDLLRNDLGKIAIKGSVEVPELRRRVTLPTVHHQVATIRARLAPEVGVAAILHATFPGGSITGCPKIRAMEIIAALEPCRRGVYTGAIGWIAVGGDLRLNVAIRTMTVVGHELSFHAGGGIIVDSEPSAEHAETLVKSRVFLEALGE